MNRTILLKSLSALIFFFFADVQAQSVYFVDALEGSDQNSGKSESNAWKTVSKVNSSSFGPGDRILFRRGQVWREKLSIAWSGTPSSPVYFGAYGSGAINPLFYGAETVTEWVNRGGNIWKACQTPDPRQVFFDGVKGTVVAGIAGVASPHSWYWAADTLYIYSTSSPASAYRSPGVEAPVRGYGIVEEYGAKSYITIDSIDVSKVRFTGISVDYAAATGITFENLRASYCVFGIYSSTPNTTIRNVRVDHNGWTQWDHGIYVLGADGFLVENCHADSNSGAGIHAYHSGSGRIRGCTVYDNGYNNPGVDSWGIVVFEPIAGKKIDVEYNVVCGNTQFGIDVGYLRANDTVSVYNNVVYDNGSNGNYGGICLRANDPTSKVRVKNNISYQNRVSDLQVIGSTTPYQIDFNCYYRASGTMVSYAGTNYTQAQFPSYQTVSGMDAHALSTDPLLVDPARQNFMVSTNSPCINRGTNVGLTNDIRGAPVPSSAPPDIGAYELGVPSTPALLSPPRGVSDQPTTPRITWRRSLDAATYRVRLSTDSMFATIVVDTVTADTSVQIRQLATMKKYYLQIRAANALGVSEYSATSWFSTGTLGAEQGKMEAPLQFGLRQNYPNPFNPTTTIEFTLAAAGHTILRIYNALGAEVATLVSGPLDAGGHRVQWNAIGLATGVYFLRLQSGTLSAVGKLNLLK